MDQNTTSIKSVEIIRITPSILEKGQFWFAQNLGNIKKDARKITSWWFANFKEIEQGQKIQISEFTRLLGEWGYIRGESVKLPGQFAQRGGIIDVFPINSVHAWRVEFDGNYIETILPLKDTTTPDNKEKLKNIVAKPAEYKFTKKTEDKDIEKIMSMKPGTYAVHIDHGIARFAGIENSDPAGSDPAGSAKSQYIVLQYAQGDTLKVPLTTAHKVEPYIGFAKPALTRLGGNMWHKIRRKVKEDLIKTAKELAKIYASRELTKKTPYKLDREVIHEAEKTFQFIETPDQTQAIADTKKDLMGPIPMDRIICGDVGFGKTEVALRAASFAVSAGRQVALIAPTTVLAHQHYKTFTKRFSADPALPSGAGSDYPINIAKLTRIEKKSQQKQTLQDLKSGRCDIVIGTHRLLQKDVDFAKLGLLVIDEEQRFGVRQKETFKEKRAEVDVLSLSATPIPRTLYFALSGIRDMSVIETPPHGRKAPKTKVARFKKEIVKKAIQKELARGGQVYYLHNRIASLPKTLKMLQQLVPDARIEFMHAKLPEAEIIDKIDRFETGKIDVLVTTTIMENGLDMQNANTLIADDATRLGLAQAHQIRGRIGRSDRSSYAYFLYPSQKLPEKSKNRLEALKEAQYLGAGHQIALRDLELRGAGNMLGREQSGNIAKVGFNLYCQLLNEAIEELRSSSN